MTHCSASHAYDTVAAADFAAWRVLGYGTFEALAYYDTTAINDAARRSAWRAACVAPD